MKKVEVTRSKFAGLGEDKTAYEIVSTWQSVLESSSADQVRPLCLYSFAPRLTILFVLFCRVPVKSCGVPTRISKAFMSSFVLRVDPLLLPSFLKASGEPLVPLYFAWFPI